MPKVRLDGYEFYFFSNEGTERYDQVGPML